jgi:hypothetical protein
MAYIIEKNLSEVENLTAKYKTIIFQNNIEIEKLINAMLKISPQILSVRGGGSNTYKEEFA